MTYLTPLTLAAATLLSVPSLALASPQEPASFWTAKAESTTQRTVAVADLVFAGEGPNWQRSAWTRSASAPSVLPRVVVPGWRGTVELPKIGQGNLRFTDIRSGALALTGPLSGEAFDGRELQGTLYLANPAGDELVGYAFTIPAGTLKESDGRWRAIEASRYRALATAAIPGTAWFRRRAEALGGPIEDDAPWTRRRSYDVGQTFAMFSGGRALAENLALDDVITPTGGEEGDPVELASLESVSIPPLDFAPLVEGLDVKLDPLSAAIPHDQHAVFFPSFGALVRVVDQVGGDAAPLVHLLDGRSQNARVRDRYETQMCLELSSLDRAFGAQFVDSVAMTGSDTYLRTGSDVAVLFQGKVPGILGMMRTKVDAAAKAFGVRVQESEIQGRSVASAASADRTLCVHLCATEDFVIVANSKHQLGRVLSAADGQVESLDELPEYHWFRNRYPLEGDSGDEDALAVVSDAAIRRWAGPKWRIATSRRTKAAAVLADADAWRLGHGMGLFAEDEGRRSTDVPGGGAVTYDAGVAMDETYGRLAFLTPIAELDFTTVSEAEKAGYLNWRRSYERAWTASFDPIAASFDVTDDGLAMDLTLVPLIVRSQYGDLIELAGPVTLKPGAGDHHPGAIAHWTSAIDTKSRLYRQLTSFVGGVGNGRFGLDWVGEHIAIYLDHDAEYFAQLGEVEDLDGITEEMLSGLPVGIEISVKSPLALAGFLTGIRGFIEDAVPGMFTYESRDHAGRKYVAITPADDSMFLDTPSLYYVALPDAFVVSFSETLIQRALGRSVARRAGEVVSAEPAPWTGTSTGLQIGEGIREALAVEIFELAAREEMRSRSWANLAILNEWKAAGAEDAVAYHEEQWGIRLVCAGGGEYVWNEAFQTMESTVFGHPADAKNGPNLPPALLGLKGLDGALTFERVGEEGAQGLRVQLGLQR